MRVCIGVCIGRVKHVPLHEFLTPNEWKDPYVYVCVYLCSDMG